MSARFCYLHQDNFYGINTNCGANSCHQGGQSPILMKRNVYSEGFFLTHCLFLYNYERQRNPMRESDEALSKVCMLSSGLTEVI